MDQDRLNVTSGHALSEHIDLCGEVHHVQLLGSFDSHQLSESGYIGLVDSLLHALFPLLPTLLSPQARVTEPTSEDEKHHNNE